MDTDKKEEKPLKTTLSEAEEIRQKLNNLPIDDYIKQHTPKETNPNNQATKGYAASMHIVSGVLVGGVLGYGVDYLANTIPLFIALFIPLGMIAGFRNMINALNLDEKTNTDKDNGDTK